MSSKIIVHTRGEMKSFAPSVLRTYKRRNKAVKLTWKYLIYGFGMFAEYLKITIIFF